MPGYLWENFCYSSKYITHSQGSNIIQLNRFCELELDCELEILEARICFQSVDQVCYYEEKTPSGCWCIGVVYASARSLRYSSVPAPARTAAPLTPAAETTTHTSAHTKKQLHGTRTNHGGHGRHERLLDDVQRRVNVRVLAQAQRHVSVRLPHLGQRHTGHVIREPCTELET